MAYMPDYGVGYFYSVNTGNEDAFDKIGKAIRAYITRNLALPALPPEAPLPAHATDYAGWYEYDASRTEVTRFLDRLAVPPGFASRTANSHSTIWEDGTTRLFRSQARNSDMYRGKKTRCRVPVATIELLTPNEEGRFVEAASR